MCSKGPNSFALLTRSLAVWPMQSILAVLNRDGNPTSEIYPLPDVGETGAVPHRDGTIYVAHVSALSSVAHSLYHKLDLERLGTLPHPITPIGGVTVLGPR